MQPVSIKLEGRSTGPALIHFQVIVLPLRQAECVPRVRALTRRVPQYRPPY